MVFSSCPHSERSRTHSVTHRALCLVRGRPCHILIDVANVDYDHVSFSHNSLFPHINKVELSQESISSPGPDVLISVPLIRPTPLCSNLVPRGRTFPPFKAPKWSCTPHKGGGGCNKMSVNIYLQACAWLPL